MANLHDVPLQTLLEAFLFATDRPLTLDELMGLIPEDRMPERTVMLETLDAIRQDYKDRESPIELVQVASGYRLQIAAFMGDWVARLFEERTQRYSRALLETLAIIAYRQPVTRGDIEAIRGVSASGNIVRTLLDRDWIQAVGHKEVPGRPVLYATTPEFLDYFSLQSLEQLPPLTGFNLSLESLHGVTAEKKETGESSTDA